MESQYSAVSADLLTSLLDQGMESDRLDYKRQCNINDSPAFVELVKDIAAMMVKGGYIVIGANDDGTPSEHVDESSFSSFDSEKLTSKVQSFIDGPFQLHSRVLELQGHHYLVIHVLPHLHGFAILKRDGQNKSSKPVFRAGEIFIRHDTKSERCNQGDIELIQGQIVNIFRERWMTESAEHLQQVLSTQVLTNAARLNPQRIAWDIDLEEFESVFQQLLIQGEEDSIRLMLIQSRSIVEQSLTRNDPLIDYTAVLDRLLAMTTLTAQLSRTELFKEIISAFHRIYELPISSDGLSTRWTQDKSNEVWESILVRLYALGGLVVRLHRWEFLPLIFDTKVRGETGRRYGNWIRHGITMAARSRPYSYSNATHEFNPIALATQMTADIEALHPESFNDEDMWLSSICQFDFLNCVFREIHDGREVEASYYPSFAIYRSSRTEPVAVQLTTDAGDASFLPTSEK